MRCVRVDKGFSEDPERYRSSGADLLEIPLDLFDRVSPGKLRLLCDRTGLRALASAGGTGRGGNGLLENAIHARFDLVKLELDMDVETRGRIIALARKHGAKVVLYQSSPRPPRSVESVVRIFQKCSRAGGDLGLAGFQVSRAQDVRFLRDAGPAVRAMGLPHGYSGTGRLAQLVPVLPADLKYGVAENRSREGLDMATLSAIGPITRLFAIVGEPAHPAFSAGLYSRAFREQGQDCVCLHLFPEHDDLGDTVKLLDEMGFDGFLVGRPFREKVLRHVAPPPGGTGAAGAVIRQNGRFAGRDTGGPALLAALDAAGVRVHRRRALVLGPGGAARSAAAALRSRGAQVVIAGRNLRLTLTAAAAVRAGAAPLSSAAAVLSRSSLLVNCIPEGALEIVGGENLRREMVVADLACCPPTTPLLACALEAGALTVPGTSVAVQEACSSLRLFTGETFPRELLEKLLARAAL